MPGDHYWEWTRKELLLQGRRNNTEKEIPEDEFEPGDFAYYEGTIHEAWTEFLQRKGYRLTPTEDTPMPKKGRYCLVLQRLSQDKYLICYCASYGGAIGFQQIRDPVARHFGIPFNENAQWPGVAPLRTSPPWKSIYGAYILAIPMICEGLRPTNVRKFRIRLIFQDLQRLRRLIRDRSQSFYRYADDLRAGHSEYTLLNVHKLPNMHQEVPMDRIIHSKRMWTPAFQHPNSFHLSDAQHNISWLLRDLQAGNLSRSVYLNSLEPRKRPLLARLPIPFFAATLRVTPVNIARILSRSW